MEPAGKHAMAGETSAERIVGLRAIRLRA